MVYNDFITNKNGALNNTTIMRISVTKRCLDSCWSNWLCHLYLGYAWIVQGALKTQQTSRMVVTMFFFCFSNVWTDEGLSCFTMLYHDGCANVSAGNGNLDIWSWPPDCILGCQHDRCGVTMVFFWSWPSSSAMDRIQWWLSIQLIVVNIPIWCFGFPWNWRNGHTPMGFMLNHYWIFISSPE